MGISIPFSIVKKLLQLLASRKRLAFIEACKNPAAAQRELRDRLVRNSKIALPEIPVDYHFYQDQKDLTQEKVLFHETTSGSTGKKKEIPYTKTLLKSFENMFLLWAHDLIFHSQLDLKKGKFFMSVSPQIGESKVDDRKYLSAPLSLLLSPFLASHPDAHRAKTGEEFLMKVSQDLLSCRDLEVISIWSPTYFLSILNFMRSHSSELKLESDHWEEIWPKLKLISCWAHGQASSPAEELRKLFPNTRIQPKGLLLTEAPVTIPWSEAGGNVALVTETYLEFLDQEGHLRGIEELKVNEIYSVVTSQGNGFLRYKTHDLVKVKSFYYKNPVLEFLGREGITSDLAGEKFSEMGLQEIFEERDQVVLLFPDTSSSVPGYTLLVENENQNFEEFLLNIHHYRLARELQQLRPLQVRAVKGLRQLYLKFYEAQGMVLGDIKEKILFSNPAEAQKFLEWIDKEVRSSH